MRMDAESLSQLKNFVRVSDRISSSGQPSEAELVRVSQAGFRVLVNLGLAGQAYSLEDEGSSARALGLEYHHIPVQFAAPAETDYQAFEAVMLANREAQVFVHCAANYRVSCFIALYGERYLGWDRERANAHIRSVWEPDPVWTSFLE